MKLSFSPSFKRMPLHQQIDFTRNVVKSMSENPRFLPLETKVRELNLKLAEWETAIEEAQFGGKMRAIKKIEKGLTVLNQLDYLARQVETVSFGKKEIVDAAGFGACCESIPLPVISANVSSELAIVTM